MEINARAEEQKAVAQRFRALRRRAMLRQCDLARLIELHRRSIIRIERGLTMPRARTLRRFAALEFAHSQHPPMQWS